MVTLLDPADEVIYPAINRRKTPVTATPRILLGAWIRMGMSGSASFQNASGCASQPFKLHPPQVA